MPYPFAEYQKGRHRDLPLRNIIFESNQREAAYVSGLNWRYMPPANENLTIHYELTQNATVELNIYDVSSRLVESLVSVEQTSREAITKREEVATSGIVCAGITVV